MTIPFPKPSADNDVSALDDEPGEDAAVNSDRGLWWRIGAGTALCALLVAGVGGWAATAEISGAVIAPGQVIVDGNAKKVQHPTGGVIGEIRVRNGDKIEKNAVLVRLDATQTKAALGIVEAQIAELTARRARLEAQRKGEAEITFPEGFETSSKHAKLAADGERTFYRERRKTIAGQKNQLNERIKQLREEIKGLTSQRDAKARELELVRGELARVKGMFDRKLIPITRLLEMQRQEARIAGEHGALISQIARTNGQISEIKVQILTLEQTDRTEAQRELRDVEGKLAELRERRVAAWDQLQRIDIRAPQAGIVHDLKVFTVGGVVKAAEPLMLIVPTHERTTIEVRIAPKDIDQVKVGQKARLRFSAFSQRTTPELMGTVADVGAAASSDSRSGEKWYRVRISFTQGELAKLGKDKRIVPGMPVEAFIQTGDRTALNYFLKPLTDQFERAFREE